MAAITTAELHDLITAAAEQHGIDDIDDPDRQVHDLEHAVHVALMLMTTEQRARMARRLEEHGLLAGWL